MDDQQKMTFILWTGDFTRVFADFIHRQCFELSWELWMRTYVTYFKSSWFAKPQSTAPMGLFRWWMLQDSQRLGPWWCQRPAARCDQKASEMMKWLWLSYLSWTWRNPNILSFHEVWWNFQIFPVLYHLKITWKSPENRYQWRNFQIFQVICPAFSFQCCIAHDSPTGWHFFVPDQVRVEGFMCMTNTT